MPSFLPPPSSPAPQPQRKQSVDVRTLSLAQLHHFAKRGSRRAKAELERRMQAADETSAHAPSPAAPTPRPRPAPTVPGELGAMRTPRRAPPTVPGELAPTPRPRPAPTVPGELGTMRAPRRAPPTVPGELAPTPRPRPAPTVPGELGAMRTPRRAPPTVPGELAPTPRPRPAPTVPGELGAMRTPRRAPPTVPGELAPTPRPRPAPTVPGELAPSSMPQYARPTVPGALTPTPPAPAPEPAPAPAGGVFPSLPEPDTMPQRLRPAVDMDIGSDEAPARHFTPAPFPTTEMLGELLPMADTSDKPFTPSYSVEVRPEDILLADAGEDDDAAPHLMAVSKTEYLPFPSTEVIDSDHPAPAAPPAASAPAHKAHEQLPPLHLREAHTPETRLPPHLREPRQPSQFRESLAPDSLQPSQFRESRAPDSHPPRFRESHAPDSLQPSQFRESRASDSHPPQFRESHAPEERHHRRRKARRPEGVPSRPVPLHVPEADAAGAPGAPGSQQERMAEQLAAITRQESAQSRADDVPRFIGLVIMIWGLLVTFGGIFMLARGHGFYFLASGLVIIGVGWLLFKRRRLALPLHLGALVLFLVWAWSGKSVSALEAFTQAAPLLVPGIWMLFSSVREPLE